MNSILEHLFQSLSKFYEVKIFISEKEVEEKNKLLSMLLNYIEMNVGKIDYSKIIYLNSTLIDLALLGDDNNATKIKILQTVFNDTGFDYFGKDREELKKLLTNKFYASVTAPMFMDRIERDKGKGLVYYAAKVIEYTPISTIAATSVCYWTYGPYGLSVLAIALIEEALVHYNVMELHYFTTTAAGVCIATNSATIPTLAQNILPKIINTVKEWFSNPKQFPKIHRPNLPEINELPEILSGKMSATKSLVRKAKEQGAYGNELATIEQINNTKNLMLKAAITIAIAYILLWVEAGQSRYFGSVDTGSSSKPKEDL